MPRNSVGSGDRGRLSLDVDEVYYDAAQNYSDVAWALYLEEATPPSSAWSGGGISATVGEHNIQQWWGGTFGFDFRPAGGQFQTIASGTNRVYHDADGTRQVTVGAGIGYTGSSSMGGPTSITNTITLTTLKVVPGAVTGLTATRVNDGQTNLAWSQSNASNGAPTSTAIEASVNGGAWTRILDLAGTTSAAVSAWPNSKIQYRVASGNAAGWTGWAYSNVVYTTPGAPTNPAAVKNSGLDIVVSFTPNVPFVEHTHEVQHGVVAGGVTTWDSGILATLPAGTSSYTHAAPNSAQVHIYRIRSVAGGLSSAWATTGSVQLLTAPNKPTVPAMNQFADKASALDFAWVHNPVDTTPQTAYEFSYSTNGGTTWSTTGKVTSGVQLRTIAANAYAAGVALTTRVRTWGSATTGGSEGTGASPWSDSRTVTFKTVPTATITAPANGGSISDSTIRVTVGFAQPEAATFVKTQLQLLQGATLLEELDSSLQAGITLATPAQNGVSYTVRARVQDSNGLWSAWVSSTFSVAYLAPVPAVVTTTFLPDSGFGQINLKIAAPGGGQSAAVTVTITRTIDGVTETIVKDYPAGDDMAFLDTTPTVNGVNTYVVTTKSALGAQSSVASILTTTECRRAYLSKGAGYASVVVFGGNLSVNETLGVATTTIQAAGRVKPIGLYGVETSVQLKVSSFIFEGFGSPIDAIRDMLLVPGKACFRDASGRRVFGSVKGSVAYKKTTRGDLSFNLTETS